MLLLVDIAILVRRSVNCDVIGRRASNVKFLSLTYPFLPPKIRKLFISSPIHSLVTS
jgi:hypothetical protein